jgi:hypothetical protein
MLLTVKSPIANIYNNNKKSEIVTQILLGENFITQNKFGKFFKGYKAYDKYEGFIEAKDLHLDKRKKHIKLSLRNVTYIKNLMTNIKQIKKYFLIQKYLFWIIRIILFKQQLDGF